MPEIAPHFPSPTSKPPLHGLGRPSRAGRNLLLVGRQSTTAQAALNAQRGSSANSKGNTLTADSILEAVLLSGDRDGRQTVDLILIDVAGEVDHLETGIRSLRRVNPHTRIFLLCEPVDEAFCRKALRWGADDYFIVPLDARDLRKINNALTASQNDAGNGQVALAKMVSRPSSAMPAATASAEPALPLSAQSLLLEELCRGTVEKTEFAEHAVATLAECLGLHGRLRFVSGPEMAGTPAPRDFTEIRRSVVLMDQSSPGALVLQTAAGDGAKENVLLEQAAHWLAGMLGLSQRYEQLRSLAITDELSGAYNRRYFMKFMAGLLERAGESSSRVTLLLFDIDDFKKYNDIFGHASGDAIIRELIKLLRACTRPYDLVARVGGDEFAVVYRDNEAKRQPNSEHPKDVLTATERFREAIKNHHWPETCKIKGTISISGGLATFPYDANSLETLMAKADEALLQAKSTGKNVILLHGRNAGAATVK